MSTAIHPDPRRRWNEVLIVGLVFAVALAVRLAYLYDSADNPTFRVPTVDSSRYDEIARLFAAGEPMDPDFFRQPSFYPLFLSSVYRLTDGSIVAAKVVQAIIGSLTCVLVYYLGLRATGRVVGIVAAAITAFYGPLIFFETELLGEGWAAFWAVALVLLFIKPGEPRLGRCLLLGICGALAAITRPTLLPFFIVGCLWWLIRRSTDASTSGRREGLGVRAGGLVAGFLIVAFPVALTSWSVVRVFNILPGNGALNLYIGNNPDSCTTLSARPGRDWQQLVELPSRQGISDSAGQRRFYYAQVADYIRQQPLSFARGLVRKTAELTCSREIPNSISMYVLSQWSPILKTLVWKAGSFGFPFGVLLPLAVVGVIWNYRRIPCALLLFVVIFGLSVILVHVNDRYRVPMIPAMSVLAAMGLISLLDLMRRGRWMGAGLALVILGAVGVATSRPNLFCLERINFEADLYHNLARHEMKSKERWDQAVAYFEQALKIRPDYPDAHNNLANLLSLSGRHDEAKEHYREALRIRPDYDEAHNNLGALLFEQGQTAEAIEHFNKALQAKPDYAEAHHNLAVVARHEGRLDDAVKHDRRAIELKPDYQEARQSLANTFIRQGKFEETKAYDSDMVGTQSDDPLVHHNLGEALFREGKLREAAAHFKEAVRLKPGYMEAYLGLGNCLARMGMISEAKAQFERVIQIKPDSAEANIGMGMMYMSIGDFEGAMSYLDVASRYLPNDPILLNYLGIAMAEKGYLPEAIDRFKRAINLRPEYAEAHKNLGQAFAAIGRYDDAITEFTEGLRLQPDDSAARAQLEQIRQQKKALRPNR